MPRLLCVVLAIVLTAKPGQADSSGRRSGPAPLLYLEARQGKADAFHGLQLSVWAQEWRTWNGAEKLRRLTLVPVGTRSIRVIEEARFIDPQTFTEVKTKSTRFERVVPSWGEVILLQDGFHTLRTDRVREVRRMRLNEGVLLGGRRCYFIFGKERQCEEYVFEFGADPFVAKGGTVTVRRIRNGSRETIRTEFATDHPQGSPEGLARIRFEEPRESLPVLYMNGSLDASPRVHVEGHPTIELHEEIPLPEEPARR